MDRHLSGLDEHNCLTAANDEISAIGFAATGLTKFRRNNPRAKFEIYCTDRVRLTSTLQGGGDWHWRLIAVTGTVIADCGGYADEAQCLAAISFMRTEAGRATLKAPL